MCCNHVLQSCNLGDRLMTTGFHNRRPGAAGIAFTVAIHAGVAAVALLAVQYVTKVVPPPPIIVDRFDELPAPPPTLPPPTQRDQVIHLDVRAPVIEIETPQADNGWQVTPTLPDPGPIAVDPGPGSIAPPPIASGPTRTARLDAGATQPGYPSSARRSGEEGKVVLEVAIASDGRVTSVRLLQSSGSSRLDDAAIDHARLRWHFTPALKDGTAVASTRSITVHFQLAGA
jgi:periplasmic protein TonB